VLPCESGLCWVFCSILTTSWKSLGDKKHKVPRSGLFQTKLTQKAANLVWYRNKKDEGIVFAKYFTPFSIPAMALCYTAVSLAIHVLIIRHDVYHRLNAALMSGLMGNASTSVFRVMNTKRFMPNTWQISTSLICGLRTTEYSTPSRRRSMMLAGRWLARC
jgi:hypothetical protein